MKLMLMIKDNGEFYLPIPKVVMDVLEWRAGDVVEIDIHDVHKHSAILVRNNG